MKIALPTRQNNIDQHFGHCEYYTIYTTNEKAILSEETLPSPKDCGCKSGIAKTLADHGVTVMLAGNMGENATSILNANGIEVIRGCLGNVKEVALSWLSGKLIDSKESCHSHECGDHEAN